METDKTKTGVGNESGSVNEVVRAMWLTENEAVAAVCIADLNGCPQKLFISTKRPEEFPLGSKRRFRNKYCCYCWTVLSHEGLDFGRTHVLLGNPKKVYGNRGTNNR